MGERNGPLSPNIFVPAPPLVEGLKGVSADQIRTPPTRGGGWRKACVEGRRKTAETLATLSGANCGEGGTGIAHIDPVTYRGTSETNQRAPKAEHERPSSTQEEASTALDSYPSIIASSPAKEISSPPPMSLYSAEELSSDDDPAFDSSENSLSEDEDNFAAQAPIEKPPDSHHSRNGHGAMQDLVRDGDCQQTSWSMDSDPAKRTSRGYSSHHSSSKNHSNLSLCKSSSSNLKNASQSSSGQSKDRPIMRKSSRSPHSQAIGSHSSLKRSSRSPCSNSSKDNSPVKKSSQSSHASQSSKNHSAVKRSSCSPLSSRSKNSPTKKRSSQSPHASRSKNRSHEKKTTQSPHASQSKTHHSGAKRASRSPHGSRAKNHSSVKRSSRSPHSSRAKNHSPVKEQSRLPHSSQSKNKSSTKKSSKSPQSKNCAAVKSSRPSPKKRSSQSPGSTHTRNKSPMQRTSHSRSRNRSPVSRIYSPVRLKLSPSRNRSLMKRIKKMFKSKSPPCSRPRSRSRSPLRRTTRIRPSRSRSRSPLRRIGKLRSRSHSPRTISDRLKLSPSSHQSLIKGVKNTSESKSSPCFGVRVDISTDLPDDKTLKEVVFQRFVKYGFVTSVEVHHSSTGRYVLVFYDQKHEQQEALIDGPKTRLYSKTIEVTPWAGSKVDDDCGRSMWNDEMTKFSPASTRTLLIENLVKTMAPEKLDDICVQFDDILDIEVQQEPGVETCSALVEFSNITSLIKAGKALDKDFFGTSKVKVSFAKSTPTNCLWLDGLPTNLSLDYLTLRFSEYGPVAKTLYDCLNGLALVFYKHEKDAVTAMKELKCGVGKVSGHRVMVDYASSRTQLAFCQSMKESGENYLSD